MQNKLHQIISITSFLFVQLSAFPYVSSNFCCHFNQLFHQLSQMEEQGVFLTKATDLFRTRKLSLPLFLPQLIAQECCFKITFKRRHQSAYQIYVKYRIRTMKETRTSRRYNLSSQILRYCSTIKVDILDSSKYYINMLKLASVLALVAVATSTPCKTFF